MAALRVMCGVAIFQMILALSTLGMCSTQYYTADYTIPIIPHVAVYFLLRALPLVNLLVCGLVGTVTSCLNNKSSRGIYLSLNIQTALSLVVLVWYFIYWVGQVKSDDDRMNAVKCLSASVLSLISCVGYLLYELTCFVLSRNRKSDDKDIEEKSNTNTDEIAVVIQ